MVTQVAGNPRIRTFDPIETHKLPIARYMAATAKTQMASFLFDRNRKNGRKETTATSTIRSGNTRGTVYHNRISDPPGPPRAAAAQTGDVVGGGSECGHFRHDLPSHERVSHALLQSVDRQRDPHRRYVYGDAADIYVDDARALAGVIEAPRRRAGISRSRVGSAFAGVTVRTGLSCTWTCGVLQPDGGLEPYPTWPMAWFETCSPRWFDSRSPRSQVSRSCILFPAAGTDAGPSDWWSRQRS